MKPTPQEQNVAIAEILGWDGASDFLLGMDLRYAAVWIDSIDRGVFIPNYTGCLNACAEMEESLKEMQKWPYVQALYQVLESQGILSCSANTLMSTAPQRCEAFLHVHNAWKE